MFFIFSLFFSSFSFAQLDCITSASRQLCATKKKPDNSVVTLVTEGFWQHPATVQGNHKPFKPVGQVVDSIPVDRFLPSYFQPRRSALGYELPKEEKEVQKHDEPTS